MRRCIMTLLPVPDLLRLSATSRGNRADLFSLMRGDLSVQLSVSLLSEGDEATDRKASFRAFLCSGGAPLVKSLALDIIFSRQLESNYRHGPMATMAYPPLPALERLAVICKKHVPNGHNVTRQLAVAAAPVIVAASQLRSMHFDAPRSSISVSPRLDCLSGAAASAGGSLTDVSFKGTPAANYRHVQK